VFEVQGRGLTIIDADGSNRRSVAMEGPRGARDAPAWSPNGKWIVLSSGKSPTVSTQIYAVRPDGTGLHAVTRRQAAIVDSAPAWQPR
jgi:Tol biopolymer transport system component